jgi:hypothetical protein
MEDFTKQQPKAGTTILQCAHFEGVQTCHWFRIPGPTFFTRPDGSGGSAEWVAICDECFAKNPQTFEDLSQMVAADGVWQGNDPAIRVNPDQPERFEADPEQN